MSFFSSKMLLGSILLLLHILHYMHNNFEKRRRKPVHFLEGREETFTINFGQDPMWVKIFSEEK